MGARGRNAKPVKPFHAPAAGKLDPPAHLRDEGAAFFRRIVARRIVAEFAIEGGAVDVLTRAGECIDRMAAARASIAEHGEIGVNQYGEPKLNPACSLEKVSRDGFYAAMRLLDLEIEP